jgi:copper chaperone CopZ
MNMIAAKRQDSDADDLAGLDLAAFEEQVANVVEEMKREPDAMNRSEVEERKKVLADIESALDRVDAEAKVEIDIANADHNRKIDGHMANIAKAQQLITDAQQTVSQLQNEKIELTAEIRRRASIRKEALQKRKRANEAFLAEMADEV